MIIVVVGPTGVGKTKLSVALAKKMNAEVVNADAMQVYKGLDIATAKIKEEEKEGIIHHLFDIATIYDNYTIYDYQNDARYIISQLENKGKNIILVGGSGLYIKAALYDYKFQEETTEYDFSKYSNKELLSKVKEIDEFTKIHVNNRRRLERFLTKHYQNLDTPCKDSPPLYDFVMIGLTTNRDNLYNRINKRVDKMVDEGIIEEARSFYEQNIHTKALKTGIGYKELYKYFDGEITLNEALDLIKKNSRHYAKRQYTFFNNQFKVNWFNTNYQDFNKTIDEVVNFLE